MLCVTLNCEDKMAGSLSRPTAYLFQPVVFLLFLKFLRVIVSFVFCDSLGVFLLTLAFGPPAGYGLADLGFFQVCTLMAGFKSRGK